MLGLFGSLNMAARSLSTQQRAAEVAGHNLANVNTPGYARQRVNIATALAIPSPIGPQGTGAEAVGIQQIRDLFIDRQITSEASVRGSLESQRDAVQLVQAALGQQIDRAATGSAGAAASTGIGGQHGLAEDLSDLFNAFQGLSTDATSSAERQTLIIKAQNLATQFNQVSRRLGDLKDTFNESLSAKVDVANLALADIAKLNEQIAYTERTFGGPANDLRDQRQTRLEDLARLVNLDATTNTDGSIDLSIDGATLVSGPNVLDQLETYDSGGSQLLVRVRSTSTPLTLSGGAMQGLIDARDGELARLQTDLDALAANVIAEINSLHTGGYGLAGTTGETFFNGTDAATIQVNAVLVSDPGRIQASDVSGDVGNNKIAVALAQLAEKKLSALNNQTLQQSYGQTIARMGQTLNATNVQLSNQQIVEKMLAAQRESISGVSLDEEMTDLIKFQRAYEASAKLIVTIDEMLETVVNLKR